MEKIKGLGIKWLKRCKVDPIFDHGCQQVLWTLYWPLWYLMAAYLRLSNLAMLRPAPLMHCLLTMAATSQMACLRRLRLLAFDVMVMFPGKKPPWLSATSRLGKPWVYCTLAGDHDGACQIMTLSYLSDQKTQVSGRLSQTIISVLTLHFLCLEPDSFKSHC